MRCVGNKGEKRKVDNACWKQNKKTTTFQKKKNPRFSFCKKKKETYRAKLLKRDLAIAIAVCVDDGLVHDLLQLGLLQIAAHHELEHLQEII